MVLIVVIIYHQHYTNFTRFREPGVMSGGLRPPILDLACSTSFPVTENDIEHCVLILQRVMSWGFVRLCHWQGVMSGGFMSANRFDWRTQANQHTCIGTRSVFYSHCQPKCAVAHSAWSMNDFKTEMYQVLRTSSTSIRVQSTKYKVQVKYASATQVSLCIAVIITTNK